MITDDYQDFVEESSIHHDVIQARLYKIRYVIHNAQVGFFDRLDQEKLDAALNDLNNLEADLRLVFVALGVAGEAGEFADKVKKHLRGDDGSHVLSESRRTHMLLELGDTLWYVVDGARQLGSSLQSLMRSNMEKLTSRIRRGKRQGDGDDR